MGQYITSGAGAPRFLPSRLPAIYRDGIAPITSPSAAIESQPGIDLPYVDTTAAADLYLRFLGSGRLSGETLTNYAWGLRLFNEHIGSAQFGVDEVVRMLLTVNFSDTSLRQLVEICRRFCRWLDAMYGIGDRSIYFPKIRPKPKLPRVLTVREIHSVLAAANDECEELMVLLMLDTGIRVGEAANLRMHHLLSDWFQVDGKTGQRQIPITDTIAERLRAISNDGHIWHGRRGPIRSVDSLKQKYRRIFRNAGILLPDRKNGPHVLRHTFATYFLKAGGNILSLQNILGHSNIQTTLIYLHLASEHHKAEHTLYTPTRTLGLAG